MRKHLASVISYFAQFSYFPTFDEIYTFFPKRITKRELQTFIRGELEKKNSIRLPLPTPYSYTLPQYSISPRIQTYITFLKWLPLARFVGVTGRSAMEGMRMNDDIDLFIITKKGFLWTTRFVVVLLAKLLGIHGGTGVCLNLFFDERDLVIPIKKQNGYIAHELLQMKPILDKYNIYTTLLGTNAWIFKIFPNSRSVIPVKKVIIDWIPSSEGMTQRVDMFFRSIQMPIIKKNNTGFRITPTQLWLFRNDFEKKLKKKGIFT